MSSFDPNAFLNTEVSEANATAYVPVPEGEFNASIKLIKPRVLTDGRAVLDLSGLGVRFRSVVICHVGPSVYLR